MKFSGTVILKADLKELFSLEEENDFKIDALIYPQNKHNVPSATKFLLLFIKILQDKDLHSKVPYRFKSICEDLQLYSPVLNALLAFYVFVDFVNS